MHVEAVHCEGSSVSSELKKTTKLKRQCAGGPWADLIPPDRQKDSISVACACHMHRLK
jgi:hypothetical protein